MLLVHGDDDQIVPIQAAAPKAAALLKNPTLKIFPGAPHGIAGAYQQDFDRELLAFISS